MARPTMDVGVVPGDVVVEQEAVAAEQVAGVGEDPSGGRGGVQLGEAGHGQVRFALVL